MSDIATNSPNDMNIFNGPPVKQMRVSPPTGTSSSAQVTSQISRLSPSHDSVRTTRRSARLAEWNRTPGTSHHRLAEWNRAPETPPHHRLTLHMSSPATPTLPQDDVIDLITPPPSHSVPSSSTSGPLFNPTYPPNVQTSAEYTPQRSGPNLYPDMPSNMSVASPGPSLTPDTNSSSAFTPFMYSHLLRRPPSLSSARDTGQNGSEPNHSSTDHTHNGGARSGASSREQQRESVIRNSHRNPSQRSPLRIPTMVPPSRTPATDGLLETYGMGFMGLPPRLVTSEQTVPALPSHTPWSQGVGVVPSRASDYFSMDNLLSHPGPLYSEHMGQLSSFAAPPPLQHSSLGPQSPVVSSGPVPPMFVSSQPPTNPSQDPFLASLTPHQLDSWSPVLSVGENTSGLSTSSPLAGLSDLHRDHTHPHSFLMTSPSVLSSHASPTRSRPPSSISTASHLPVPRPRPLPPSPPTLIDSPPLSRAHPPPAFRSVLPRTRRANTSGGSGSSVQSVSGLPAGRLSRSAGRSVSGRSEAELIVVDDSDSDDDVIIEGWTPAPHSSPWSRVPHTPTTEAQVDLDAAYARRLQAQYNNEARFNRAPGWQEIGASIGGGPVIPAGPSIPRPSTSRGSHPSGSGLIRDNFEALASRVQSWTREDASRFLHVASSIRPRGRRGGMRRHLMERMPTLLVRAIVGEDVVSLTYEDLLEIADNLGPARPQGLNKATLDGLPVRHFEKSVDGEDQRCVVCMSSFEKKEKVRSLPCSHEFHQECIDEWFKEHKTCPICRVEIKSE